MKDRPDYAAMRPTMTTTAVPESLADRPDYHGSLNPLSTSQREVLGMQPNISRGGLIEPRQGQGLIEPRDKQALVDQFLQQRYQTVATPSPIKVFTVCINAEIGTYIAFLGSDPTKKATAGRRELAVARLLAEQKLIVMTEID